jgi:hypothetical protein
MRCKSSLDLLIIPIPGVIPDIVSDLVIMDDAKEVREVVTSPLTNVSAVFKRKEGGSTFGRPEDRHSWQPARARLRTLLSATLEGSGSFAVRGAK